MKNLLFSALMILASVLFIAVMPTEAEGAIYEDTVRLHILANSDTEEDQKLKLALRDAILEEFAEELSVFESASEASDRLRGRLSLIESFASDKIKALGYSYPVSVTLSEEWYDTREYENFTLPKGNYLSLKIKLGEAEGKNWWCVMFPPLCLDVATESGAYTKEEDILITQRYSVRFKILEIISSLGK